MGMRMHISVIIYHAICTGDASYPVPPPPRKVSQTETKSPKIMGICTRINAIIYNAIRALT